LWDGSRDRLDEVQIGVSVDPITGMPVPTVGVALKVKRSDRQRALVLINELEKRRILYEAFHLEMVTYSVKSVLEIRDFINLEVIEYKRTAPLVEYAAQLVEACQQFLTMTQFLDPGVGFTADMSKDDRRRFRAAIKALRRDFARRLYEIVVLFKVDIDDRLARIMPLAPGYDPTLIEDEDEASDWF
jgi:hypothetical protein